MDTRFKKKLGSQWVRSFLGKNTRFWSHKRLLPFPCGLMSTLPSTQNKIAALEFFSGKAFNAGFF
jgi:hypothetical protein